MLSADLTVRVLGAPEVSYGPRAIKFRSRKELALLIYLAVSGGRHTREKLIDLFWPNSDRKLGQAALRNTLVRVRQALGEAGTYLQAQPSVVSLEGNGSLDLDVRLVEAAAQAAAVPSRRITSHDLAKLEAAVSVYRGDFLEGFSLADAPDFDDWASRQREAWYQHLDRIFDRLSRLQFEGGQIDEALRTMQRWIEHNPLNEAGYRRLMQVHVLAGDRTAALQTFQHCTDALATELAVEPDEETVALAERIRTDTSRLRRIRREDRLPLLPDLPFVGRAAEHRRLVAVYEAACSDSADPSTYQPQAVHLVGEAGIGKTRMTQTFLEWASVQGADILTGRAFEAGGRLPYGPLVSALRERLDNEQAPTELVDDIWLAELSQLLPELHKRHPALPPLASTDPNFARSHLFEAIAQLIHSISLRRPVILGIDDVQWADAATRDAIPYLCRRWTECGSRVMLLLTVRHESLLAAPDLREWLVQIDREISTTRLELQPLSAEATRQLVHALADPWAESRTASQRFGHWLFTETAGQPYFMAETVKMLVERDIVRATSRGDDHMTVDFEPAMRYIDHERQLPMPPSVREVILTRLARLSQAAEAILTAGAVLGRACTFEQLSQVSGIDEISGLSALAELVKGKLMVEASDAPYPYTLGHDKIRTVVYTEAGQARRTAYHRRAFDSLRVGNAPATALAHHALAASMMEPAYRYSIAAGDAAGAVYAHVEAARHYRRALDLLKRDDTGKLVPAGEVTEVITDLYLRVGRMLELASRYEEALSTYEEMESLGREWGERSIELAAMLARITPLATVTAVFDPEGAEDLAKRALELARALGDQIAEVTILWKQLIIYRYTNRLMEAIPHGERALALARKLGLRERTAFILQDVGYCFGFMADFAPAQRHIREAGAMWQELGDLPMLMDTLMASCAMCGFAGRYDEAIAYFEESLTISQKIGTVWALAGCRHNIGFVLADRGEVERAIAEMEEGIRLSEQVSFMSPLVVVRTDLARLFGALGALEPAIELARLAVLVAGAKVSLFRGYALPVLTHLLILQGNLAEARESVHEMETDPNRDGWGVNAPGMFQVQTELALAEGRYDEAAKLAADAVTVARREGVRAFLPSALDLQARAYLELGQREAARDGWLEARREAEALGARLRLWPILLALCRLEHDPNVAASLQTQARGVVAYIADRSPPDLQTSFLAMPAVQEALNAP